MNDIFQEVDEELRRDQLRATWAKYKALIVTSLVLVVGGTAAYSGWNTYQTKQQLALTTGLYEALDVGTDREVKADPEKLMAFAGTHGNTPQAILATMSAAGTMAQKGDKAGAVKLYDAVAENAEADGALRHVATLYSTMLQIETAEPALLLTRLAPLTAKDNAFRYSALELSALAATRAGDKNKAREIYTELSSDEAAPVAIRNRAKELIRTVPQG